MTTKRAAEALLVAGIEAKDGPAMTAVAEDADLDKIPADAASLHTWLGRARDVLPRKVSELTEPPP